MRKPFMVEFTGTPEAGKTTAITNVSNNLISNGFNVQILKESAESLPVEITKGCWDANLWMHFQTQSGLVKAKYLPVDVVLIDRGLVDSNFYGKKFLWEKAISQEQYSEFRRLFMEELFPDCIIALMVDPNSAIERRGGEGKLVNEDYIKRYNAMFLRYYEEITVPKTLLDTSKLGVIEMNKAVLDLIKQQIP